MTVAAEGRTPPGRVFSVTALTQSIRKNLLSNNAKLAGVWIEGEVSGNKIYGSGHRYFALKDANATISCVLFAFNVGNCDEGFLAALRQKSMVTNKIYRSGSLLAGISVDFKEKGFRGIRDYKILLRAVQEELRMSSRDGMENSDE